MPARELGGAPGTRPKQWWRPARLAFATRRSSFSSLGGGVGRCQQLRQPEARPVQPLIKGGPVDAKELHGFRWGERLRVMTFEQQPVRRRKLIERVGQPTPQAFPTELSRWLADGSLPPAILRHCRGLAARRASVSSPLPADPVDGG